jgi:hypothetical protein
MPSPFKDILQLEAEVRIFINRYKSTVVNSSKRVSDYFEMGCYNDIVKFYREKNYTVAIQNLQKGAYRYKCTTAGLQSNFSYFKIESIGRAEEYEIHHNLAVQSSWDPDIFTTPDISVIKKNCAQVTKHYYDTGKPFSFVANEDLVTFCECKNYAPYPELIFGFVGILNELFYSLTRHSGVTYGTSHIAPSLMISGKPNKQTLRIKQSLENRYQINIIFDLFYSKRVTFSKSRISKLRTL